MIPLNQTLSVLLVEDDQNACKQITEYAKKFTDINISEVTNNSHSAYKYVVEHAPDAVILDLELQQGGGSGLQFLTDLHNAPKVINPYILVTTNNCSQKTYEYARRKGADFILYKHSDDYTNQTPIDFLRMTKDIIISSANTSNNLSFSSSVNETDLKGLITQQLETLGFQHRVLGFKYLIEAIYIVINEPDAYITQRVAAIFSKSTTSVDRAMQTSIDKVWKRGCLDTLYKEYTAHINPDTGAPTITEFVHYYADKFRNL
ncbi:MAG: response regulator [Lachnospiraceae bacterium]|nr:response regulator [Lachnospiraceae bacterium]